MNTRQIYTVMLAALAMSGCERRSEAPTAPTTATAVAVSSSLPDWPTFVDQFIEAYFVARPPFAASQGRHEFDGQLPDWTAEGLQKEIARLEQVRSAALQFKTEELQAEQKFQRDYLVSRVDTDLFWLRDARQPFTNPAWYFDNGLDPSTYITVPYASADERLRAFIKYANAIPAALTQIRTNLKTPLPQSYIRYGINGFNGMAAFYRKDVAQAFAEVKDAALLKDLQSVIEPAAQAMADMGKWLESELPRGTDSYALGAERFAQMVGMTEGVTTPVKELEAIGRADLDRNLAALTEACKALVPGKSIKDCIARVSADKPKGGAVAGARSQLTELRQFVADHAIVTIPGTEQALVEEAPPYRRANLAYINIPGPYEKNMPSVYYIAPPDPSWTKAEQDEYIPGKADLMFTSAHEVWPGHFLQFLHSNRSSWRFGQLFVGYAFAEGWAHYVEELMVEEGIAKGKPDLHVGQLMNALLRNVRYLCAIGLHTQGMSVSECEKMFQEKAYQDIGNARQQAARGTYDPAYLNYTLGKLMIRKLRTDWQAAHPGEPLQKFHDEFLSYGGPQIPLVRAQMLKRTDGELF
jgi:uncharacterized protein (DUF885 family)